jgi:uncharacterized protein (DUF1330 family)
MSCYFIARINIHDKEEYKKYLSGSAHVFSRFNGRYLAVADHPEVLEGEFTGRIVLIEFPCREDLLRWYRSPEYQELLKHRLAAAQCNTLLVEGIC